MCPLDWGIGHASRSVPLIELFEHFGFEVTIAAGGRSGLFLKQAFPRLQHVSFRGPAVTYPENGKMTINMLRKAPSIIAGIIAEHHRLDKLARTLEVDLILSDNRFGLWNKDVYSIYITHQLHIKAPSGWKWAEPILRHLHGRIINKYDECWIPDHHGEMNLSGSLSHPSSHLRNPVYIGPLSRFAGRNTVPGIAVQYDLAVILSGPEPQRTILEKEILAQAGTSGHRIILLRGLPGTEALPAAPGNVKVLSHANDDMLAEIMMKSELVVCRSGYSSVMDLVALGQKALLVPTPGQTEQEYLASYLKDKGWFDFITQDKLDINQLEIRNYSYAPPGHFFDLSLPGSIIRKLKEKHDS